MRLTTVSSPGKFALESSWFRTNDGDLSVPRNMTQLRPRICLVLDEHSVKMIGSWYDTDEATDEYNGIYASLIETENKKLLAFVYNIHNGYYAHNIYYTSGELKLDVFEEDWI